MDEVLAYDYELTSNLQILQRNWRLIAWHVVPTEKAASISKRINHGSIRSHTAEKRMEVHIAPVLLQELIKEPLVDLGRVSVPTHVVSLAKRRKFQFLIPAVLLYFTRYGGFPNMRISYNKLRKMLIDKNMKKSDLREKAGISSASLAKLGKGDNITTDVLLRICEVMDCRIEDILETVRD